MRKNKGVKNKGVRSCFLLSFKIITKKKQLAWHEKQTMSRNEAIKHAYESGGYSMKEIGAYYRFSRII